VPDAVNNRSAGKWKDAGHGRGIVPIDMPEPKQTAEEKGPEAQVRRRTSFQAEEPVTPLSHPDEVDAEQAAHHYYELNRGGNRFTGFFLNNFTIQGLMQKLLRKTIRRNTWMYVSVSWSRTIGLTMLCTHIYSGFRISIVSTNLCTRKAI
jgi:hypothetical protein